MAAVQRAALEVLGLDLAGLHGPARAALGLEPQDAGLAHGLALQQRAHLADAELSAGLRVPHDARVAIPHDPGLLEPRPLRAAQARPLLRARRDGVPVIGARARIGGPRGVVRPGDRLAVLPGWVTALAACLLGPCPALLQSCDSDHDAVPFP